MSFKTASPTIFNQTFKINTEKGFVCLNPAAQMVITHELTPLKKHNPATSIRLPNNKSYRITDIIQWSKDNDLFNKELT